MKKYWLLLVLCGGMVWGQAPEWYQQEMERTVGSWVADNSVYMSEQETDDAYGISWEWGVGKKSLLGSRYGLKETKVTNEYWQFFQFWDTEAQKARVIQISPWGVIGEGFLERTDKTHTRLQQHFVMPNGTSYESGHTTEIQEGVEISVSFDIKEGEWLQNRSYTWKKQHD